MQTYHLSNAPDKRIKLGRPIVFTKIKVATVVRKEGEPTETRYVDGYRARLASRDVRLLKRAMNNKKNSKSSMQGNGDTLKLAS